MSKPFNDYLNHHEIDTTQLAKQLEVPYATAWRIRKGRVIPNDRTKIKIYILTKGVITPNDFYDLPRLESERNQLNLFGQPAITSQSFPESPSHTLTQNPCQQSS